MKFRLGAAAIVFIGSYLPLSLILLAQNFEYAFLSRSLCFAIWESGCSLPFSNPIFSIGIFLFCLICFLITLLTLKLSQPKDHIVISEVKHTPTDLMNYTLPYVVSFMSIEYQDTEKFIGFLIFLGWMFWITYKSGQIILNPVLIAFGWKFYEITYRFAGGTKDLCSNALCKSSLQAQSTHKQISIQEILIIK